MAGRKRKLRRRKPCGRIAQDKRPDDRLKIAAQPHRRGVGEGQRVDEHAESALGRALLRREIDQAAYDAGVRFTAVVGEYRASIEAPKATAGSGRGFTCYPIDCRIYPSACHCLQVRERYCRAYDALAEAGRCSAMEVVQVAIQGEEPMDLIALRAGLATLARHFGYR